MRGLSRQELEELQSALNRMLEEEYLRQMEDLAVRWAGLPPELFPRPLRVCKITVKKC